MSGNVKVDLKMNDINRILRDKGLSSNGSVQSFHTNNVMRRMVKFMPYVTGATIKVMIAQTDISKPYVVVDLPYAKYLYHGMAMEGEAPKTVTDRPLNYSHGKNPQAGPYWDRRLVAAEGKIIAVELQRYINRR